MKKLLLVVAAGIAFGYFGACLVDHAWKYYKGEEKDEGGDDDDNDTVSRNKKKILFYSQKNF